MVKVSEIASSAKRLIFGVAVVFLLNACSLNVSQKSGDDDKRFSMPYDVKVQSMRTTPKEGSRKVSVVDLQPGDILLSRDFNLISLGIRMFTTSSVSHASVYIGNGQIAEAVGSGIRIVDLTALIDHSLIVAAYRYPGLTSLEKVKIREFAHLNQGNRYNFRGIVLTVPFTIARQACELRPLAEDERNNCLNNLATAQFGEKAESDRSFFCSEFVIAAYNYAGQPITDAEPIWISPDDLMHMREGDIRSMPSHKALIYVGHLKAASLNGIFELSHKKRP